MKVPYIKLFDNVFVLSDDEIILNDIVIFGIIHGSIEQTPFRLKKSNDITVVYPLNNFKKYIFYSNKLSKSTAIRIDKSKFFQIYEDDKDYVIKVEI